MRRSPARRSAIARHARVRMRTAHGAQAVGEVIDVDLFNSGGDEVASHAQSERVAEVVHKSFFTKYRAKIVQNPGLDFNN